MKTVGITAEYDPFHNGHLYQLRAAKERTGADCAVVVLGGDFLQRGLPGMYDKWTRARMALEAGADLVIQLPHFYSCNSGKEYAGGAVSILDGLGCVEHLCFGSEEDDLNRLRKAASVAPEDPRAGALIRKYLEQGRSHPESVTMAVADLAGEEAADLLRRPNNLLAVEYLRALERRQSSIRPAAVRRLDMLPAAESPSGLRSAGEIRKAVGGGSWQTVRNAVPESTYRLMQAETGQEQAEPEQEMLKLLLYRIRTMDRSELAAVYTVSEGLETRLSEAAAGRPETMDELIDGIQTKRYTRARIRRTLVHVLAGFRKETAEMIRGAVYARVLGFSPAGRELLRRASETASIPILSNLRRLDQYDERVRRSIELDLRAADLRAMICGRYDQTGSEKNRIPLIIY